MMMWKKDQRGFTLIELLIVIAILAVLALVALPRFLNYRQESVVRACRANQGALTTAIEQYQYYANLDNTVPAFAAGTWYAQVTTAFNYTAPEGGGAQQIQLIKIPPVCPQTNANNYALNASQAVTCPNLSGGIAH